jgi:cardiolipin synthase
MVSAVLALLVNGLLPVWLAALIVLRDLIIVSGALCYLALIGRFQAAPSMVSKLNTGVLILVLLAVMAAEAFRWDLELTPLLLLCGATTLASGIGYVIHWGRRARQEIAERDKP